MARAPPANETETPVNSDKTPTLSPTGAVKTFRAVHAPAAPIVGTASNIEKRAASSLPIPKNRAAVIVMPERLTPGTKASI